MNTAFNSMTLSNALYGTDRSKPINLAEATSKSKQMVQDNNGIESTLLPARNVDTFTYSEDKAKTGIYSNSSFSEVSSANYISPGVELYNKLNGKTVSVSYTGGSQNNIVTINLSEKEMNALYGMCRTVGIECSTVLAIMAHESGFNRDATSSTGACGLMQIQPEYYEENLTRYSNVYNIAKTCANIGDDIVDDPYNVYGNMAAGISELKFWSELYGEADMIKAYAQGAIDGGWTPYAINADNEIRAVKSQIDAML